MRHHPYKPKGRKKSDPDLIRHDAKVYCWRGVPQQSPLPLQLSVTKVVIFRRFYKLMLIDVKITFAYCTTT